jgi:NADPH:quinone reductase
VGSVVFEDAYAEILLADPCLVSHVLADVDATAALALVRSGLIAPRARRVASGESVLVTAAASGTSHRAVQLAKAIQALSTPAPWNTARSE